MSYFESVLTESGLNRLPSSPFQLLDLNYLVLDDGKQCEDATGDREVLAVVMGGTGKFAIGERIFENVGRRPNVFTGKPYSVYLPRDSHYVITAQGHLEVSLVSAPSELACEPYVIPPERVASGVWGAANFSRNYHQILTLASQPDLPAARLIVGETYTPSGNWSTFPPHRHEKDDLPREAFHEELYLFKVNPADGFGITRYYNGQVDSGYIVRNNTILMVPQGYHTVVSAPGYTTYYLWALAGNQRTQATVEDPSYAWVGRTVPMLQALGH